MSYMHNAGGRSAEEVEEGASVNEALKLFIQTHYRPLMRQREEYGVPGIQCVELEDLVRSGSVVPKFWTSDEIEARRCAGSVGWDQIAARLTRPRIIGEALFGTTVAGVLYTYVAIVSTSG